MYFLTKFIFIIYTSPSKSKFFFFNVSTFLPNIALSVAISDNLFDESSYKSCNSLCEFNNSLYFSSSALF